MPRAVKGKKNYTMYNETLYEVERVVQIKWVKNRQYCYIKWKGYDERFNTWEPKEHITFCYNYVAPDERDDDPEYSEPPKTPNSHHQYHTRAKIKPANKPTPDTEDREKEDHTHLDDAEPQQSHRSWKPFCERHNALADHRDKDKDSRDHKDHKDYKDHKDHREPKESCKEVKDSRKDHREAKETHKEVRESRESKDNRERARREEEEVEEERSKAREDVVAKILWLNYEEANEKRIGKVMMESGKTVYLYEDVLKAHYPEKVIEYYEQEMRQRTLKPE